MSPTLLVGRPPPRVADSHTLTLMRRSFGTRLRRLRIGTGMTQEELAERCVRLGRNMLVGQVRAYEQDLYLPSLRTFVALARALEVSLDELWGDDDP